MPQIKYSEAGEKTTNAPLQAQKFIETAKKATPIESSPFRAPHP